MKGNYNRDKNKSASAADRYISGTRAPTPFRSESSLTELDIRKWHAQDPVVSVAAPVIPSQLKLNVSLPLAASSRVGTLSSHPNTVRGLVASHRRGYEPLTARTMMDPARLSGPTLESLGGRHTPRYYQKLRTSMPPLDLQITPR